MVKKGDFVKIEYTGYDEKGAIFDSTSGEVARKLRGKEGPTMVVLGVDFIVRGLEKALLSMKKGEEREIILEPEEGFGEKKKKLVRTMPINYFYQNNINPEVGTVIQVGGEGSPFYGVIKSVSGGRVLVDFNHPLAGQRIKYKLKLVDVIEDVNGKIKALLDDLGLKVDYEIKDQKLILKPKEKENEELLLKLMIAVRRAIPELKDVEVKKGN